MSASVPLCRAAVSTGPSSSRWPWRAGQLMCSLCPPSPEVWQALLRSEQSTDVEEERVIPLTTWSISPRGREVSAGHAGARAAELGRRRGWDTVPDHSSCTVSGLGFPEVTAVYVPRTSARSHTHSCHLSSLTTCSREPTVCRARRRVWRESPIIRGPSKDGNTVEGLTRVGHGCQEVSQVAVKPETLASVLPVTARTEK